MPSVQLSPLQKFSYYLLPLLLTALGIIPLYFWMSGKTNQQLTTVMTVVSGTALFLLALVAFLRLKRSLRFYQIISDKDVKTKIKIAKSILRDHKWIYTKNNYKHIQATGNGFRDNFDLRALSELFTIEIDKQEIRINSICDPGASSILSMSQSFSFGKNRQNIRDFEFLFLQRVLDPK